MVTPQDVQYAYRLLLGREPESKDVVERLAEACESFSDLRTRFVSSPEFALKLSRGATGTAPAIPLTSIKPLGWDKINVEVNVSDDELSKMVGHVETIWDQLGRSEPHWSVVTHDKFRSEQIGANEAEFFATGEIAANAMRLSAARYGIDFSAYQDCFELGCGVGRVTTWLSRLFPKVYAADISASHLEIAKEALATYHCSNVELIKLTKLADIGALPKFDAFFSVIVLQHNPPPVIASILRAILGNLRPGGIGYFQVPTYSLGYRFIAKEYLATIGSSPDMEMHVLPQNELFAIIEQSGCQLLEIREDSWTGAPTMVSNSVLVKKL